MTEEIMQASKMFGGSKMLLSAAVKYILCLKKKSLIKKRFVY